MAAIPPSLHLTNFTFAGANAGFENVCRNLKGRFEWNKAILGFALIGLTCSQSALAAPSCEVEKYYTGIQNLRGAALSSKLHEIVEGHTSVSYVHVWDALKVLDSSDTGDSDSIVEIYSQKSAANNLAAKVDGWNREHLWPRSYGLKQGQPEFTDLHNLRPADSNVNSSRGNKYFGDCSLQSVGSCLIPANREAAMDTATDKKSWRPPAVVRGDVARAVMYMAIRYSPALKLSDTPTVASAEMGLLSVLLMWNKLDPPSPSEQLRNDRVCELYQHNRNPFVDHPEFADEIWG